MTILAKIIIVVAIVYMAAGMRAYTGIPVWKAVLSGILSSLAGALGIFVMGAIENGQWGPTSFYGVVLISLLLYFLTAKILRIPAGELLDLCAIGICFLLFAQKIGCWKFGCCKGRIIGVDAVTGDNIRFPSQLVESGAALIIGIILLIMLKKGKYRGTIYFRFMIIYGSVRFFLNLLRDTSPFIWILPAGNFWSIISVALGLILLYISKRQKPKSAGHVCENAQ